MAEPLRHRQTKGAETDMPGLLPLRHFPTLLSSEATTGTFFYRAPTAILKSALTASPGGGSVILRQDVPSPDAIRERRVGCRSMLSTDDNRERDDTYSR